MGRKMDCSISIFCNNCIEAMVLHDYGLPFNSPTVNLMIPQKDYIEYILRLDNYIGAEIVKDKGISNFERGYPTGLINGKLHLHFIHYKNYNEALDAWRRREKRINKERIYFILVETDERFKIF